MPLSARDIRLAFDGLAGDLARDNRRAEMFIVGGAALVLLFDARASTKDVDAVFLGASASFVRDAAGRVADEQGLPRDWLNDAAKGYVVGLSAGETVYDAPSLLVRAASTAHLLAMKLAAWRDAVDRSDAQLLLETMSGSAESIWAVVRPFVPEHDLAKASYAFDDLWEALHGPE
jgi:predicted nucleotidyltransferase